MPKNFYRMFPDIGFAFVKLQSRRFSFEEAEEINHRYKSDPHYACIRYLLIEVDQMCMPEFAVNDLEALSDLYNAAFQANNHQTIVWLVSEPIVTAMAHLFVLKTNDNSLYCSTLPKAYELLNMPVEYHLFVHLISLASDTSHLHQNN